MKITSGELHFFKRKLDYNSDAWSLQFVLFHSPFWTIYLSEFSLKNNNPLNLELVSEEFYNLAWLGYIFCFLGIQLFFPPSTFHSTPFYISYIHKVLLLPHVFGRSTPLPGILMQHCRNPWASSPVEMWDDGGLSPFAKSFLMSHLSARQISESST